MFLANVDVAIANVAAPSIKAGLHAGGGELELIVSGYTLAYAVLLVTSARLGEGRGYRRMFLAGLGGFTVASAACGFAPDAPFLIRARIAAGAAAALMAAQVLTAIQRGFSGQARARAIGLYTLALSVGAVAGQSPGGLLISADVLGGTWRPAFLVNVPCGVLLLWLAWRHLPRERAPHAAPGMIGHLAGSVTAEHAADVSGLFNTAARGGAVVGTAAFGTLYLALVHHPGQATRGFAVVNLALAGTALAAAAMAGVSVRRR